MIFDIFLYNNETKVLDIRLNQHCKYVDKFIIIIGDKSFAGKKNLIDEEHILDQFKEFKNQIIVKTVNLSENPKSRWINEKETLNYINKIKDNFKEKDILLISDVDEILNIKTLEEIKYIRSFPKVMQVATYYYFLNGRVVSGYTNDFGPMVINKEILIETVFDLRKKRQDMEKVMDAGWHFSYLGSSNDISKKINNFSHSEFDNEQFNNLEKIQKAINNGDDLFSRKKGHKHFKGDLRSFKIIYEDIDNKYPEYILKNKEKFKELIKKPTFSSELEKKTFSKYFNETEDYILNLKNDLKKAVLDAENLMENTKESEKPVLEQIKKSQFLFQNLKEKEKRLDYLYDNNKELEKELSEIKNNFFSYCINKIKKKINILKKNKK